MQIRPKKLHTLRFFPGICEDIVFANIYAEYHGKMLHQKRGNLSFFFLQFPRKCIKLRETHSREMNIDKKRYIKVQKRITI
jgi:hypothetical protein